MKQTDFLATFSGSQARARLLRIFVFNQTESLSAPQIAKRTGITPTLALRELKALEMMGILKRGKGVHIPTLKNGTMVKKIMAKKSIPTWSLDADFEHMRPLATFVHDVSPARHETITNALKRAGKLSTVILSGHFVGDSSRPADLIVGVDTINKSRLETALKGLEQMFGREIRYAAFTTPEFRYRLTVQDRLIRDTLDFPHLVLLDRTKLF
jgi:DNA-binding Lrp family transcriptional regulator